LVLPLKLPDILCGVDLWLFDIKEGQENFRSKFVGSFRHRSHQSWQSYKPTQDDLVLHPNHPHTLFGQFFLLFFISTTQKYSDLYFMTFDTKTHRSCKPTKDDLDLHQNLPHIIFG